MQSNNFPKEQFGYDASFVLLHGIRYVIIKIWSTATKIESWLRLVLGQPKMKVHARDSKDRGESIGM